jgi:hypothetical protein
VISQFWLKQTNLLHPAKQTKMFREDYYFKEWIEKIVKHPQHIVGTSSLFADGSSAAMWFAGLVTEPWVNKKGVSDAQYRRKGEILLNHQIDVMKLSVLNFHRSFLWVGLLGEYNRSMNLFQFQTNLNLPEVQERNSNTHPKATAVERAVIAAANPMDMALYEYMEAVTLARLEAFESASEENRTVPVCKTDRGDYMDAFAYPFIFNGTQIWPPAGGSDIVKDVSWITKEFYNASISISV